MEKRPAEAFSVEIDSAGATRLGCALEVVEIDETPAGTAARLRARFFGRTDGATIIWATDTPGIQFDNVTESETTARFGPSFDKTTPFVLGFNVGTSTAAGQPLSCQAACGTSPSDLVFLGTCLSTTAADLVPAPTTSTRGLVLSLLGLLLVSAIGIARRRSSGRL